MIDLIISFVSGVAASLIATWLYAVNQNCRSTASTKSLEGLWVEEVLGSERPFSLCELSYNRRTKKYLYSGCSYFPDGTPFCDFESEMVHIDLLAKRMFYIYRYWETGKIHHQTYGFGWTTVEGTEKALKFGQGHYRSSDPNSVSRHTQLRRLTDEVERLGLSPFTGLDAANTNKLIIELVRDANKG